MSDHSPSSFSGQDACLRVSHLDIGYNNEIIVPDINFELECGQSLALVGVNGSGKTTLLKTIVGLLPPVHGEIGAFGRLPGKNADQLAYLSQFHSSGFILPLRVIDVVRMGRFSKKGLFGRMDHTDEEIIHRSMQRMGIEALKDAPLRSLSGGQQQRTYLAQVLARQADLIILDEPAAGLDAAGQETLDQALSEELSRGAMVVIATHDIHQASECTYAMLLAKKVIAFGPGQDILTPEALLETFGIVLVMQDHDKHIGIVEREHGHGD